MPRPGPTGVIVVARVNTSRREKRGKTQEVSTVNFGVKNEWGELSFYRES